MAIVLNKVITVLIICNEMQQTKPETLNQEDGPFLLFMTNDSISFIFWEEPALAHRCFMGKQRADYVEGGWSSTEFSNNVSELPDLMKMAKKKE